VGSQAHADRYTYLPLTGLAIALAWGAPDLLGALRVGAVARRRALALAGVAAVAALAGASRAQLRHWRDSEALFRHALAVTEGNYIAHAHLGDALLARGEGALAVQHWEEAVRLRPDFLEAANNLAWLLATSPDASLRDPERALAVAGSAARLVAGDREAPPAERASVLDTLAAAQAAAGRFPAAAATAERAVALAEAAGDPALAADLRSRLALYRAGAPFVER
jgi:tetratricopeptide (TPR) repeat protein